MAKACKHEWIGTADGVHCAKCGKHLSHDEYLALFEVKEDPKPKKKSAKK